MGQTTCRVIVDGDTCEDIISFDYVSDILAVAEEAHFVVAGSKKWRDKLKIGASVQFIMQNAAVNGGVATVEVWTVARTPPPVRAGARGSAQD